MNKLEAINLAKSLVDEVCPATNARGYSDGALKGPERVKLVLEVADWFLAGEVPHIDPAAFQPSPPSTDVAGPIPPENPSDQWYRSNEG